jgi:hypothetical protein
MSNGRRSNIANSILWFPRPAGNKLLLSTLHSCDSAVFGLRATPKKKKDANLLQTKHQKRKLIFFTYKVTTAPLSPSKNFHIPHRRLFLPHILA